MIDRHGVMVRTIPGIARLAAFVAGSLFLVAVKGAAAPAPFGNNYYDFVVVSEPFTGNNNSWEAARDAASASTYNGIAGHLATIGSQSENDFLLALTGGAYSTFAGAWIGGRAPAGWLVGPEAGQAFTYTDWASSEPNNAGYAYMIVGSSSSQFTPGEWADDSGVQGVPDPTNDPVVGYFVEYEEAVVPTEGTSWGRIKALLR
jgi:hypothetical protein